MSLVRSLKLLFHQLYLISTVMILNGKVFIAAMSEMPGRALGARCSVASVHAHGTRRKMSDRDS